MEFTDRLTDYLINRASLSLNGTRFSTQNGLIDPKTNTNIIYVNVKCGMVGVQYTYHILLSTTRFLRVILPLGRITPSVCYKYKQEMNRNMGNHTI